LAPEISRVLWSSNPKKTSEYELPVQGSGHSKEAEMDARHSSWWRIAIAAWLAAWGSVACSSGTPKSTSGPQPTEAADAAPADETPAPAPTGPGVQLRIEHPDAEVFVDGERIGLASDLEAKNGVIELPAGIHQISVRKPGFKTWRAEVAVKETTETIDVSLEPSTEP
jgi:hypothetical protein